MLGPLLADQSPGVDAMSSEVDHTALRSSAIEERARIPKRTHHCLQSSDRLGTMAPLRPKDRKSMALKERIILGLNSGTSADGIDAVACGIVGRGLRMKVKCIGHVSLEYPRTVRRRVMDVMAPATTRTEEICRLGAVLGTLFAEAADQARKKLSLKRIDLIGSHGQTVCHLPPRRSAKNSATGTMQIGDAAIIAYRMKCPVVHQFRQADMAAGGQGAPLIPWTDYVLFHAAHGTRIIQNIGGIANLTLLPARTGPGDVVAFDCGPGNMVMDALASHFSRGRRSFDADGRFAAAGKINGAVLSAMLKHPFLALKPPRSCGREEFGQAWTQNLLRRFQRLKLSEKDWLATATAFTAVTIARGCAQARAIFGCPRVAEMVLCGGGAKNLALVSELGRAMAAAQGGRKIVFSRTDDYGIPSQAKEGVGFAMLAAACMDRVAANLPQVTGAARPVVLGQICNP